MAHRRDQPGLVIRCEAQDCRSRPERQAQGIVLHMLSKVDEDRRSRRIGRGAQRRWQGVWRIGRIAESENPSERRSGSLCMLPQRFTGGRSVLTLSLIDQLGGAGNSSLPGRL